jgi:hypothetical protein
MSPNLDIALGLVQQMRYAAGASPETPIVGGAYSDQGAPDHSNPAPAAAASSPTIIGSEIFDSSVAYEAFHDTLEIESRLERSSAAPGRAQSVQCWPYFQRRRGYEWQEKKKPNQLE